MCDISSNLHQIRLVLYECAIYLQICIRLDRSTSSNVRPFQSLRGCASRILSIRVQELTQMAYCLLASQTCVGECRWNPTTLRLVVFRQPLSCNGRDAPKLWNTARILLELHGEARPISSIHTCSQLHTRSECVYVFVLAEVQRSQKGDTEY
jgi:hypothetical protein